MFTIFGIWGIFGIYKEEEEGSSHMGQPFYTYHNIYHGLSSIFRFGQKIGVKIQIFENYRSDTI